MIADTSRAAYSSLKASGKLTFGQRQIMLYLHKQTPGQSFTRAEIAQGSKLPLQSVCGRVNELLDIHYLEQLPTVKCPVTGNAAHPVRIPQSTSTVAPPDSSPCPPHRVGATDPKAASQTSVHGEPSGISERRASESVGAAPNVASSPSPSESNRSGLGAAEQLITAYGKDKEGGEYTFQYVAVGWGNGHPPDQDHLYRKQREAA